MPGDGYPSDSGGVGSPSGWTPKVAGPASVVPNPLETAAFGAVLAFSSDKRPLAHLHGFLLDSYRLGILFLIGTGYEWHELIYTHHLTLNRNLFGTTFYTLVGFHGLHVTAGVIVMLILLGLALRGSVTSKHRAGVELASWYWHFVDVVWIAVFIVVYVAGRS